MNQKIQMPQGTVEDTGHSANQACTARLDACASKVTILQMPTAQRSALRCIQCQWFIIYNARIQNDQPQNGNSIARLPTWTEGRHPRCWGVTGTQAAHYGRESER
jgi:hypothetical protein